MRTTTAGDITLYYEQHGQGPDLVLIGGLTSDHQIWRSALRTFSQHYRVLIFDNRGAGQSSSPDYPYTIEMMANDTLNLMDALHIKKAHILGHSMGGGIAMQLALLAPDRVDKLILVSSRPKISAVAAMLFGMREKLQKLNVPEELLAEYTMPILFGDRFLQNNMNIKGFAQWTVRNPHPQTPIGYKHQLHASSTRDIIDELPNITADTLIINGTEDVLVPITYADKLSQQFPNARLALIPDCAHMPHVEQPEAFEKAVMGFIR